MDNKRGSKLHSIIEKLSEQCARVDDSPPEQGSSIDKEQIAAVKVLPPKQRRSKAKSSKRKKHKTIEACTQTRKQKTVICQRVDDDLCIDVDALVCITPQVKDIEAEHNYVDRSLSEYACRLCFQVCKNRAEFVEHFKASHKDLLEEAQSSSESEAEEEDIESPVDDCDSDYDPESDPDEPSISTVRTTKKRHNTRLRSKNSDDTNRTEENDDTAGDDTDGDNCTLPKLPRLINDEFLKDYACESCKEEFYFEIQLTDHMANKHPSSDADEDNNSDDDEPSKCKKKYDCEHCDRMFRTRNDVLVHINEVVQKWEFKKPRGRVGRIGVFTFECKECFKKFQKDHSLQNHLTSNLVEQPLTCETCGRLFQYMCSLKRHKKRPCGVKKKKQPETQCNVCGKEFRRRDYLLRHQRIHTGIKKYQCEHCDKSFSHSGSLKTHIMLHTGERPYKCTQCDATFVNKGSLRDHDNRMHTGFMPYPCTLCPKRFLKSNHLKVHMVAHSTDKPFPCKVCGKAFKRRDHLRYHLIIHSDNKPFKCDTCDKTFNQRICLTKHLPCKELERRKKPVKAKEIKPKRTRASRKSSKDDKGSGQSEKKPTKSSTLSKKKTKKSNTQKPSKEQDSTAHQIDDTLKDSEAKGESTQNPPSYQTQSNDTRITEMQAESSGSAGGTCLGSTNVDASKNQLDAVARNCAEETNPIDIVSKERDASDTFSPLLNRTTSQSHTDTINFDKLDFTSGFSNAGNSIPVSSLGTFHLSNERLLDSCVYGSTMPQTFVPFNCSTPDNVYDSGVLELDSIPVGSHDHMLGNRTFGNESANDLGSALLAAIDPDHLHTMANTTSFFPHP